MAAEAPTISTKILSALKRIFNLGIKLGHITFNPASPFDAADAGGTSSPRDRWLTGDELRALMGVMAAASGWAIQNTLEMHLLLTLAVRKSELIEARLDEFDLPNAVWHLPGQRTKLGSAIDIPLPRQAVRAIEDLIRIGSGSEWPLPARKMQNRMAPTISPDTVNAAMAKTIMPLLLGVPKFTLHDLRRTARTHLERLGVDPYVAERCLNHKLRGLVGVYNRFDYFEQRRTALQLWADTLSEYAPS